MTSDAAPAVAEIVVHGGPGTGPDVMAQAIAQAAVNARLLPATPRISHRAGRDGADAMQYLLDNRGNPQIIATCTPTFLTTPLKAHLPFSHADLTPLAGLVSDAYLLVVGGAAPWGSVRALIDAARAIPHGITAGAAPKGGNNHIHAHLLGAAASVSFGLRFFATSHDLLAALRSGQVDWTTAVAAEIGNDVRTGNVRVLATLSDRRSPLYPDVPTVLESSLPVAFLLWRGMIGPPAVPAQACAQIEALLRDVVTTSAWAEYLRANGQQAAFLTANDFARLLDEEAARYRTWLSALGLISQQ